MRAFGFGLGSDDDAARPGGTATAKRLATIVDCCRGLMGAI